MIVELTDVRNPYRVPTFEVDLVRDTASAAWAASPACSLCCLIFLLKFLKVASP